MRQKKLLLIRRAVRKDIQAVEQRIGRLKPASRERVLGLGAIASARFYWTKGQYTGFKPRATDDSAPINLYKMEVITIKYPERQISEQMKGENIMKYLRKFSLFGIAPLAVLALIAVPAAVQQKPNPR